MKVLLAGATGAIGIPLVRALVGSGHEVWGLTRGGEGPDRLRALGARPVVGDAMDRDGLLRAVDGLAVDAVVHQLTALRKPPTRHRGMAGTNALRTHGTANLLAAARALGAGRFLTQSIILGYGYVDHGDRVLTEQEPFGRLRGDAFDPHVAAMASTEQQVCTADGIDGIALRYGLFYGAATDMVLGMVRRGRRVPVPSGGGGTVGWIHVDDAAAATVAALERSRPGQAYNVVDDAPASWGEFVAAAAAAFGAPRPFGLPGRLLRLAAPYGGTVMLGTSMRVSNAKAAKELGWRPGFPTYRDGLRALAGSP